VRVAPADAADRTACRAKLKAAPAPNPEERWPTDTPWPQSDWDVRAYHPGSRVTITDNDDEGLDGQVTLTSRAFTTRPTLRGARAVLTATTTLDCGAAPGLYPVYRHRPGDTKAAATRPWARLRVTRPASTATCPTRAAAPTSSGPSRTTLLTWTGVGAVLTAAAGATSVRLRRRRRLRPER
jgi:hypothetical protein